MPSFGEKLKAEREKRSITLDQISLSTKIGTRMLQALEEDKFGQLPGGIFNKGFVRAYARFVGIDEDQAVSDYLEASGETTPPRDFAELEPAAATFAQKRDLPAAPADAPSASRELPWGLFAAALLIIALGLSLWTHRRHVAGSLPAPATAPLAKSTPDVSPAQSAPAKSENAIIPRSSAPLPSEPSVNRGQPSTASSKSPVPTNSAPAPAPKTAVAAAPSPGEFTVLVQGREDCWISISADGKSLASYLLNAGELRAVHGRQVVIIKAGNIGGLDLAFNGKKLAPQGASGEVKTLTFGPEGLQPTAPTAITQ